MYKTLLVSIVLLFSCSSENNTSKESIISKIPSGRLGKAEDIANAVIFLASSKSDYINGETIHVNGGLYLGWQKNNFIYEQI